MKKNFLLLFAMNLLSLTYGQKSITIYKDKFTPSEILGSKQSSFGPLAADSVTTLFHPPAATSSLNELLGKVYETNNFYNTTDLLNIKLDEPMPILDSINFGFYKSYSFINVLDNNSAFQNDPKYKEFKKAFKDAPNNVERRKLLYDNDDNAVYTKALEESRYTTFQPKIKIQLSTKITNEFKLGITAKILDTIKNKANFNVSIDNSIYDSVSKYVDVTGGSYDEIRLQPTYVTQAKRILVSFNHDRSLLNKYDDDFTVNLKSFLDDSNAAIVTGAAVLEATFDFKKYQQFLLSIGATIDANIDLTQKSLAPEIKAAINASFAKQSSRTLEINTVQTYYYIRYAFSKDLSIGKGGRYN